MGGHSRNHPAAVTTVNAEIRVGCQDNAIGKRFGHAYEASNGETHGNVGDDAVRVNADKGDDGARNTSARRSLTSLPISVSRMTCRIGSNKILEK
jgi:hypothetical protein